jgi:hypothetical protein
MGNKTKEIPHTTFDFKCKGKIIIDVKINNKGFICRHWENQLF